MTIMVDVSEYAGKKIREFRKKKGLNQGDVAAELSMSQSAYAKIENGNTALDVKRLLQLSEFLEVPISDFLPQEKGKNIQLNSNNKDCYQVEHFYADGRELLKIKDEQIKQMQSEIDFLRT